MFCVAVVFFNSSLSFLHHIRYGIGEVWLAYMRRLRHTARRHGRSLMFWADMLHCFDDDTLWRLPSDSVAMEWGYDAGHPWDERCARMAEAGVAFFTCPGTSSWCSVAGRVPNAITNIREACFAAQRHGGLGSLLTDWGDYGHLQPLCTAYPGLAAHAGFSWRPETKSVASWMSSGGTSQNSPNPNYAANPSSSDASSIGTTTTTGGATAAATTSTPSTISGTNSTLHHAAANTPTIDALDGRSDVSDGVNNSSTSSTSRSRETPNAANSDSSSSSSGGGGGSGSGDGGGSGGGSSSSSSNVAKPWRGEFMPDDLAVIIDMHVIFDAHGVVGPALVGLGSAYTHLETAGPQLNGTALFALLIFEGGSPEMARALGAAGLRAAKRAIRANLDALAERRDAHAKAHYAEYNNSSNMHPDLAACIAGAQTAGELLLVACSLGLALVRHGCDIEQLPQTARTDVANRLIPLVAKVETEWYTRNRSGSVEVR